MRARPNERPAASLIIIDEAHHARARTYETILAAYPNAKVLGLTATPWRADNKGLGELFETLIVVARPRELIEQGFLVPSTGYAYDRPDLSEVSTVGADYNDGELGKVMGDVTLMGNIVQQWKLFAGELRTIVFAVHVEHSQQIVAMFQAAGVAAEHLDGETPTVQREAILERLDRGITRVVSNVGIFSEGWDCPRACCCILARPTQSLALYLQQVGRVLRPVCLDCGESTDPRLPTCKHCGSGNVKRSARIHDHAGCALEFGLPDSDREYALKCDVSRSRKKLAEKADSVRTCLKCFAIYEPSLPACPRCGFKNPKQLRTVGYSAGRAIPLEEIAQRFVGPVVTTDGNKKNDYFRWLKKCQVMGYKPGWALHQFQFKFHSFPPGEWLEEFVSLNGQIVVRSRERSHG